MARRRKTPQEEQAATVQRELRRAQRQEARLQANAAESRVLLRVYRRQIENNIRETLEIAREEGFDPVPKLFAMMFPEMEMFEADGDGGAQEK